MAFLLRENQGKGRTYRQGATINEAPREGRIINVMYHVCLRCVAEKVVFVSDCLHLCLRKEGDVSSRRPSLLGRSAVDKTTLPLEDYFGIDSQFELDKEKYVMSIVCRRQVFTLAFDNQTMLESWRDFISLHLGEGSMWR